MKTHHCLLIGLLVVVNAMPALAQDPAKHASPNYSLTPAYRVVVKLDEKSLSPFRKPEARAAQAAALATTGKPPGPNVAAVLAQFNTLGLTGVIPSINQKAGLIVLGGNLFKEGEELKIKEPGARVPTAFVAAHKVILRSVTQEALELSVTSLTESDPIPTAVPILLLEFRQR